MAAEQASYLGEHQDPNFTTTSRSSQPRNSGANAFAQLSRGGIGSAQASQENGHSNNANGPTINDALLAYETQYYAHQPKSLSGIAGRSFLLGVGLTSSSILTLYLLLGENISTRLWRAPFFVALLSLFHFLEFLTTAHTNTPAANISSFLLSSNGSAYTIAHFSALCECILTNLFFPNTSIFPEPLPTITLALGLFLVMLGQTVRSIAMVQAGTNFNHVVQRRRNPSHRLVTSGIYAILRHPSYFGFFWWGLGSQLVLGNRVCLVGYAVVLWKFFHARIDGEEELLVRFFGESYEAYRKRSWVGIPGCG
ncbi:hypothetical protein BP6252_12839 [Coleophoma cylindrospora]|uniref:Protein-S-isoprenylcysteine O-methyltransferase n=1 Tax=Coleophoma cylindrospora TaxID=1849047 RepID=A0A3D8QD12_9HELO|nr:hypothetical protein BP6252_12839 [Coleophoma cylindrospora]